MADFRVIRPRPGFRVMLNQVDICDGLCQLDVMACFTHGQLAAMRDAINAELVRRGELMPELEDRG
jgi:hypothetical protein